MIRGLPLFAFRGLVDKGSYDELARFVSKKKRRDVWELYNKGQEHE